MIKGIYTAAKSLNARMKNIEIVANNLANINTTGFKRQVPFAEIMSKYGNIQTKQYTDFRQGELQQTSDPLDMAISGNGYFVVQTDSGLQLTRNGNFEVSDSGYLTDANGNKVMGENGPIIINAASLDRNNTISVSKTGEIKKGELLIDKLLIGQLNEPQQSLRSDGTDINPGAGNFHLASTNDYQVVQGYLEQSNVNPIQEMQQMIQINTDYDSAHQMINYLDQSLSEANQVGKV